MTMLSNRKNGARRKSATRTGLLAVSTVVAGLSHAMVAHADISGFSGFSPINENATSLTDGALGYQNAGTSFVLTTNTGGEATSGFYATAQSVSSFTASYTYQTVPQQTHAAGGTNMYSLEADGMTLAFLNPTLNSTTSLGNGGGSLGYTGLNSSTAAVATNLYDGYYNFNGGTQLGTNGSLGTLTGITPDISSGDSITVRISYSGSTLSETFVDTTANTSSSFQYTGVNLSSVVGSPTAIVGFTGATGGITAKQTVSNFQFVAASSFKPIAFNSGGFTQNMVIPASAPQTGATASITASMDAGTASTASNVWYEKGYNTAAPTTGLPASGSTFTSQNDTGHVFTMQSYTGSGDAILLSNTTGDVNTTGTLTLTTPTAYKAISILESSGNGPNYFNVTINYADGAASSTLADILAPNWFFQTANIAYDAQGRAVPSATAATTFNNVNASNPVLTQQDVTLPDSTDAISSITFTYASGGGNTAIFAVSGFATITSPILIYTGQALAGQFDSTHANFYNGTNTVFTNGATVQFDDSATTANNNHIVNVASGIAPGGVLFANNTSSYTFTGSGITGSGGVSLNGTGTVTFNNSNTYTGDTDINSGTLVVGSGGNIASTNIVLYTGATLNVSGGTLSSSALNLENFGGTVLFSGASQSFATFNGSGPFTSTAAGGTSLTITGPGGYSGNVTLGAGSITINANGSTAVLTGSNSYTGGTYLKAGTLLVGSNALSGGTVYAQGGVLGAATADVNVSNLITGGAFNISSGTNILELSNAANTLTGPIGVQSGTLQIDTAGALGATTSVTVASGGSLLVNDNSGNAGKGATVTISGSGVNGNGALRGPDTTSGTPGIWAGNVNVSGQSTISAGNASTFTITGAITGTGPVLFASNKVDSGNSNIVLTPPSSTSNTYTGESQVAGDYGGFGTLTVSLGNSNGFSPASGLNFVSSTNPTGTVTVDLAGYNQSIQYLTGVLSSNYTLTSSQAGAVLTISNGSNGSIPQTFPNVISGSLSVIKTGTGSQTFSGNNSYQGSTTISQGMLSAASTTAFGSAPVILKGGTLGLSTIVVPNQNQIINSLSSFVGVAASGSADPAPVYNGGTLTLTNNGSGNPAPASSVASYYPTPVTVSDKLGFTANFTYVVNTGYADGFTFVLQNDPRGVSAVGAGGGDLGYGGATAITNSAAVEFNIYSIAAAGGGTSFNSSGGVPGDANSPTGTFISTAPVNLALRQSGTNYFVDNNNPINVSLVYNGPAQTLTETLYNTNELTTFTTTFTGVDYSALVGGPAGGSTTAFLGFTGGEGGLGSTQNISNFTYTTNTSVPQSIGNPVNATVGTSAIQLGTTSGSTNTGATVGQINISAGATVAVTVPSGVTTRGVLFTPAVPIASTGQLDLQSNDLVITGGTQTLAQVTALVASGYAGGKWNGSGIASSVAASNSAHLTALGVILNDVNGTQLYGSSNASLSPTFDGSTPADGSILVKYTYYGDANLDGAVDGSDYSLIDYAYITDKTTPGALTGWFNGDFNYDGVINGSDYTLIDNAFNQQGSSLGSNPLAQISAQVAGSAVPEPATLSLLAIGSVGLLSRRKRRN